MKILVTLACIFLPLLAATAHAGNLTLSWALPTTCLDDSPLVNCPTTGFEVNEGTSATGAFSPKETVSATTTSKVYTFAPGVHCMSLRTLSGSQKSDESLRACATVPSLPPKAPQGITVVITVAVSVP